jgi:uroporphyrinogen-III synthase
VSGGVEGGELRGRRVVVTRAAEQAGPLVELLEAAGATVIVTPLIDIVDDAGGLARLRALHPADFDWVIATSRNAALRLLDAHGAGLGRRSAGCPAIAAIGSATAAVLGDCDLVPALQSAVGLLAELPTPTAQWTRRVLVVQAAGAEPTLAAGLRDRGWDAVIVAPYRSVPARLTARQQISALSADAVLFASGSAARSWVDVFGTTTPIMTVAIGPQTAAAAQALGLKIGAVAADHSLSGMVATLVRSIGTAN